MDPVFGNIQDVLPSGGRNLNTRLPHPKSRSSFATTVTATSGGQECSKKLVNKICLFCEGEHALDSCNKLAGKSHGEKMSFLKKKGICLVVYVQGISAVIVRREAYVRYANSNIQVFFIFFHKTEKAVSMVEIRNLSQQWAVLWFQFNLVVLLGLVEIIVHCLLFLYVWNQRKEVRLWQLMLSWIPGARHLSALRVWWPSSIFLQKKLIF